MHTVAVINAGPLVALSLAGQLELLPILFHQILIPRTVYQEVAIDGLGRAGDAMLTDTMWRSRVVDAPEPDPLLIAELDRGGGDESRVRSTGCPSKARPASWSRRTAVVTSRTSGGYSKE